MKLLALGVIAFLAHAPSPETENAFSRYSAQVEANFQRSQPFLQLDSDPARQREVMAGGLVVVQREEKEKGRSFHVPGGQIQDWYGAVLLPCTLERALQVLQDYPHYKDYYPPDVTDSKLLSRAGGDFNVFLRLYRKQVLTVILNTEYRIHYEPDGPGRMRIFSRSTRIAEVKDDRELPSSEGYGFLWRLNSYWKLQQTSAGTIAECRALSLSRDIPYGLGWMLHDFVKKFPRQSMEHTLEGTRRAVSSHDFGG